MFSFWFGSLFAKSSLSAPVPNTFHSADLHVKAGTRTLSVMDEILTVSLSSFSEFLPAEQHKVHIMPSLTQWSSIFCLLALKPRQTVTYARRAARETCVGRWKPGAGMSARLGRPVGVLWKGASLFISGECMQPGKNLKLFNIICSFFSCPKHQLSLNRLQWFSHTDTGQKSGSWAAAIPFVVILSS